MIKPAVTAPVAKKQLTDIRTNHVSSNPSNVVDLLSRKIYIFSSIHAHIMKSLMKILLSFGLTVT